MFWLKEFSKSGMENDVHRRIPFFVNEYSDYNILVLEKKYTGPQGAGSMGLKTLSSRLLRLVAQ